MFRLAAHRVGIARVTGQHEGLATAAAEVLFFLIAGAARLGHPVVTTKAIKAERVVPDVLHAVVAYVRKLHWHLSGSVTGQGGSVRRDCQKNTAPAIHAGFRTFFVVVKGDWQSLSVEDTTASDPVQPLFTTNCAKVLAQAIEDGLPRAGWQVEGAGLAVCSRKRRSGHTKALTLNAGRHYPTVTGANLAKNPQAGIDWVRAAASVNSLSQRNTSTASQRPGS